MIQKKDVQAVGPIEPEASGQYDFNVVFMSNIAIGKGCWVENPIYGSDYKTVSCQYDTKNLPDTRGITEDVPKSEIT